MFSPKSATASRVEAIERISVGRIHSAVGARSRRLGRTTEEETQQGNGVRNVVGTVVIDVTRIEAARSGRTTEKESQQCDGICNVQRRVTVHITATELVSGSTVCVGSTIRIVTIRKAVAVVVNSVGTVLNRSRSTGPEIVSVKDTGNAPREM